MTATLAGVSAQITAPDLILQQDRWLICTEFLSAAHSYWESRAHALEH
jgi:hypothetical protein